MTDEREAMQREQHAKHIAMNGADISGPIERHRAGKNSFVIDDFGEHLVLNNSEAIVALADGKERVIAAWDVFRKALKGLEPEQSKRIDEAAAVLLVGVLILAVRSAAILKKQTLRGSVGMSRRERDDRHFRRTMA